MLFEKTFTISENEWKRVKNIHQRCINEKLDAQEALEKLQKECSQLAIQNKNLEIENVKLKEELKIEKSYVTMLTDKVNELLDIIQMKSKNLTSVDFIV